MTTTLAVSVERGAAAATSDVLDFAQLGVAAPLCRALDELGYHTPTPIQTAAIPPQLAGRDVLGCAQTGTGKTAAFALPLLQQFAGKPQLPSRERLRALILAPTRELALQIEESIRGYSKYTQLRSTVIFGGVGQEPQVQMLRRGIDILVATPGRLLDLHNQGLLYLGAVEYLVLDEADRMLDMGFVRDVKKIVAQLPRRKQTLLFSATMAPEIRSLADELLRDPVEVAVTPTARTADRIEQSVLFVNKADKRILLERLLRDKAVRRCVVFARTKHGADRVARGLDQAGIASAAIHGDRSQSQRVRALEGFRSGEVWVLVATDIAARGLDIDGVSHVINLDLPNEPDSYVHRIGRTARNGADGVAWSLCDLEEVPLLRDIEKRIGQPIPVLQIAGLTLPEPARPQARSQDRAPGRAPARGQAQSRAQGRDRARVATAADAAVALPQAGSSAPGPRFPDRGQAQDRAQGQGRAQVATAAGAAVALPQAGSSAPGPRFPDRARAPDRDRAQAQAPATAPERAQAPVLAGNGGAAPPRRSRLPAGAERFDPHARVDRDWY